MRKGVNEKMCKKIRIVLYVENKNYIFVKIYLCVLIYFPFSVN